MGSFVQLSCLPPRVLQSLKCQKWLMFLNFLLMTRNNQSQFGQNIKLHMEYLFQLFQKMLCIIGFSATVSKMLALENKGFRYFLMTQQFFLYYFLTQVWRLCHLRFPVNFAKFLTKPSSQNTSQRLLLKLLLRTSQEIQLGVKNFHPRMKNSI